MFVNAFKIQHTVMFIFQHIINIDNVALKKTTEQFILENYFT